MGLEEKFGETLGGLPFLDTSLIAPQTVCSPAFVEFRGQAIHTYSSQQITYTML